MQIGTTITRVRLIIKTYISLPHLHCNLCSLTSTHSSSTLLYPCQLPYIYFRTARCFSFPLKERHWDPRQLHLKNTPYVLTFSKKLSENRKGSNDLLWRIWNVTLNSNPDIEQVVWLRNTLHTFQMNRRTASTSAGEARQPVPLQPVAIINMFGFIPRAYKKKILKASIYTPSSWGLPSAHKQSGQNSGTHCSVLTEPANPQVIYSLWKSSLLHAQTPSGLRQVSK